jgi:hypothetical protein
MKYVGDIVEDGTVQAIADGAITDSKPVLVNANGTVSEIASTTKTQALGSQATFRSSSSDKFGLAFDSNSGKAVVFTKGDAYVGTVDPSDNSISFGSVEEYETGNVDTQASCFDSNSNRIVTVYADTSNSSYGTVVVGTVSGTDITFGTPVVYDSHATANGTGIVFDSNVNKVAMYGLTNSGSRQKITIGTVDPSDNSITVGSNITLHAAGQSSGFCGIAFDSSQNKILFSFQNDSTNGQARVGTINASGNSISFGTAVTFESGRPNHISSAFDSVNNKILTIYQDVGDYINYGYKGKAVVGTISGTNVSFGTPVVLHNDATYLVANNGGVSFDEFSKKFVIAYGDASYYTKMILGTVSGTTINFDTAFVPITRVGSSAGVSFPFGSKLVYDSVNAKTVYFYSDAHQSDYGKAVVIQTAGTSNNITAENYIGIADAAYATGQKATIKTTGSIARNISATLTIGQQYFVQTDGSLGTTAATPSVIAGTAIGASELIVKG